MPSGAPCRLKIDKVPVPSLDSGAHWGAVLRGSGPGGCAILGDELLHLREPVLAEVLADDLLVWQQAVEEAVPDLLHIELERTPSMLEAVAQLQDEETAGGDARGCAEVSGSIVLP